MAGLIHFNRRNLLNLPSSLSAFHSVLDDFFADNLLTGRNLMKDTFKIDVDEANQEFKILAELPGIKKEEISLEMDEGKLTIAVRKEENSEDESKNYIHRERRVSSMARSIYLSDADSDSIKAKLEDGILTITVGKQIKKDKTVNIEIQ
jgi:HSP20 family protein